jgi:hypothetical protein
MTGPSAIQDSEKACGCIRDVITVRIGYLLQVLVG